jgi:hypothetical protein
VTAPVTVTGTYLTWYLQTFLSSGLGSDATGTLVTIKVLEGQPSGTQVLNAPSGGGIWVSKGAKVEYTYANPVLSIDLNKQYQLLSVSGPASGYSATAPNTITGNYGSLPTSQVTDNGLCYFDRDTSTSGQQFRLILIQDPANPTGYRLTASNPGQFNYNVVFVGTPDTTATFSITIPYPFVTQGSVPIQFYSQFTKSSSGCFVPSGQLSGFTVTGTNTKTPSGALAIVLSDYGISPIPGTTTVKISVTGKVPSSGLIYMTVHLDYDLKRTTSYKNSGGTATCFAGTGATCKVGKDNIPNLAQYTFGTVGSVTSSQTVSSQNTFKNDPGIAGIVTDSSGNPWAFVEVQITGPDGKKITLTTDIDGVYFYNFKYTGKPATFTVKTLGATKTVTMKSNAFVVVSFEVG